ncbi:MAG TPA: cysteine desulfurase family protein [Mobilitalea sp.]|nr:cysteine desulfurase family protein [Mobilitalea sp.]
MEVYLDNSATTKITDRVRDIMIKVLYEDYGNPSSMHRMGVNAEKYMKEAAQNIADSLKVESKEIIFTSGGTEANNLALIGTAMAYQRRGKHIITTRIEHPSVHQPLLYLEENGYKIDFIPVDRTGKIIKDKLYNTINEDTQIVSVMFVNNEIGSVQDIEEIAKEIKKIKNDVIFHVDAVQAFGKYRIHPKRMDIDLLSISGHKIHGPKGIGALYVNDNIRIKPIIFGGGHQRGIRSGTENVPAIAGLGQAVKDIYENFEQKVSKMYDLKQLIIKEISGLDGVFINGLPAECDSSFEMEHIKKTAPHIVSVSFEGVRSEVLLHALEDRGVYVSSGSACSSHHPQPSATLSAIGLPKILLDSTIRISISEMTTEEEIKYAIEQIRDIVPKLRRYTRR